jgi:hypothetical protein
MFVNSGPDAVSLDTVVPRAADALVARVRLRCQRRISWMRSHLPQAQQESTPFVIFPAGIERALEDNAVNGVEEETFYQTDAVARSVTEQIRDADLEFSRDDAWRGLRLQFGLSDFEVDLLAVSVASSIDPFLPAAFAYLQEDANATNPTPWLASCLFQRLPVPLLSPASGLAKWRLMYPVNLSGNPWAANAPWTADPHIALWLQGYPGPDQALGDSVRLLTKEAVSSKNCLYPDLLADMLDFFHAVSNESAARNGSGAMEIELVGRQGSGRTTLAAQFAETLGADLMVVDTESLLPPDLSDAAAREVVLRVLRMARLAGAAVYWRQSDALGYRVWKATNLGSGLMLFGCESPRAIGAWSPATRRSVRLPLLRSDRKAALWQQLTLAPMPSGIAEWNLTPGEIARASRVAPAGQKAIIDSLQESLHPAHSELVAPLVCPFDWGDIVLPPHLREHLAELEQQMRLRAAVHQGWGFEKLCPLGCGITALFSGPSGTGKTMAAQVLARSLDLKLFRVDLAGVVNKYIGETEKRLKQVFDACERGNTILFFDEADALFGQRTQVKDAHDRFANIEIDYLLQRLEQFEGLAILATNRKGDLDRAFVRRMRFILDFAPPGPQERCALWQRALLPQAPDGTELLEPIDFHFLANKLSMTGAEITSAALGAAFLARAEGKRISMKHVLHSAGREMAKNGAVIRVGDWTP